MKDSELVRTREILEKYQRHKDRLLLIPFLTLGDYLWLLKAISKELDQLGKRALFYLAAAASDFYIPGEDLVSTN